MRLFSMMCVELLVLQCAVAIATTVGSTNHTTFEASTTSTTSATFKLGQCTRDGGACQTLYSFQKYLEEDIGRIHVHAPDPAYLPRLEVKAVPMDDENSCPYFALDSAGGSGVTARWGKNCYPVSQLIEVEDIRLNINTLASGGVFNIWIGSTCEHSAQRKSPASTTGITALAASICAVFAIFGPNSRVARGMMVAVLLSALLLQSTRGQAIKNPKLHTFDKECSTCKRPYTFLEPNGRPITLYFYHDPSISVTVKSNQDKSFHIECAGGSCIKRAPSDCTKKNYGPGPKVQSMEDSFKCKNDIDDMEMLGWGHVDGPRPGCLDGRPLLLNETHKATAQIQWVENSNWAAVPHTPASATNLSSFLSQHPAPAACESVDMALLASADEWVRRGADEYVSVASFNRFSLDLMRFGAPADLVVGAQQAALEEIGHAKHSFSLAARFAADRSLVPEPAKLVLPDTLPLSASVIQMAKNTFLEGMVGEFLAATKAQMQLQCVETVHRAHCTSGSTAAVCLDMDALLTVLEMVLLEESVHASLAFRTVRWAIEKDVEARASVSNALQAMLDRMSRLDGLGQTLLQNVIQPWIDRAPTNLKESVGNVNPLQLRALQTVVARVLSKTTAPAVRVDL